MPLETADSHNSPMTGRAEIIGTPKPHLPTEDTLAFRWGRERIGAFKDEGWLEMVRDEPCIACGAPGPSDPHHVFGSHGSLKTSDLGTIPLCRGCHERVELDRSFKNLCAVMLGVFIARKIQQAKEGR